MDLSLKALALTSDNLTNSSLSQLQSITLLKLKYFRLFLSLGELICLDQP